MCTNEIFPQDEFYSEAISFFNCGYIIQYSKERMLDEQMLLGPTIFLYRHSVELLLKALIIKELLEQDICKWYELKLPPHNRTVTSMHSIKALFETWQELLSYTLISISDLDPPINDVVDIINRIDECDAFSTFFRYPYDKEGNKNNKEFIDDEWMMTMPCSINSVVCHEGIDKFKVWHGNDQVAWLEFDLSKLAIRLATYFNGGVFKE